MHLTITINRKLISLVIMVGFFVLAVTSYLSFEHTTDLITTKTYEQLENESGMHGAALRTFVQTMVTQNEVLGNSGEILDLVDEMSDVPDAQVQAARTEYHDAFLEEILEFEEHAGNGLVFSDVSVFDGDGDMIFVLHPERDTYQVDLGYYQRSVEEGSFVGFESPADTDGSGEGTLVIVSEMLSDGREGGGTTNGGAVMGHSHVVYESGAAAEAEHKGTLVSRMSTATISDILQKNSAASDGMEVFVVSEENLILGHPEIAVGAALHSTVVENAAVTECLENGTEYAGVYPSYGNVTVYGAAYCARDLGLVLLAEIDKDRVEEPIATLQIQILQLGTAIMLGMGLLGFFASRTLSKPILRLKNVADEVAGGNFDVKTEIVTRDEIGDLANAFDSMTDKLRESMIRIREKEGIIRQQEDVLLQFSNHSEKYCVCMIDIVSSTKICSTMTDMQLSEFYKIFINSMGHIIQKYEGVIVKNIGDALLFYFSIYGHDEKQILRKCINCCLAMCEGHATVTRKLKKANLPTLDYRISATYGIVRIAKSSTSLVEDIFGTTVNRCSKINRGAPPNGLIIGEYFYEAAKDFEEYVYEKADSDFVSPEHGYTGHIVRKKAAGD